jgi:hypothetical protein
MSDFAKECIGHGIIDVVDTPPEADMCGAAGCGGKLGPKCGMMAHAVNDDGDIVGVAICLKCVKKFDNYVSGRWDWWNGRVGTFLMLSAGWILNVGQFMVLPFAVAALVQNDWHLLAVGCAITGGSRLIIQSLERFGS